MFQLHTYICIPLSQAKTQAYRYIQARNSSKTSISNLCNTSHKSSTQHKTYAMHSLNPFISFSFSFFITFILSHFIPFHFHTITIQLLYISIPFNLTQGTVSLRLTRLRLLGTVSPILLHHSITHGVSYPPIQRDRISYHYYQVNNTVDHIHTYWGPYPN